ncbi:unnamed protein product [Danaus chrysippus]|uniref:(African queen) hypothetical protein n=1 Tax=Danaus chrysippus TaxID=151541 RepID=A0A8J2QZM6_9NEOP|nr:unnamed protein product [Danaus chrysippus]
MSCRNYMKELHAQLVKPWLETRLKMPTMPTHTKTKIQNVLGIRTDVEGGDYDEVQSTSRNESVSTGQNIRKRKICGNCGDTVYGTTKNVPSKPDQETLMKKIGLLQQRINILTEVRDISIAKDDVHDEIKKLRKELKEEEKCLKKKRAFAKRAKKIRTKEKLEKTERQKNNPAATQPRTGPGQPPLVDSQPALLETIINIAIHSSAANERRRTEIIRSYLTLSDLHERLLLMGFQISRSGT